MYIPASIKGYEIFLASQSPRRRELLAMLDIPFTIAPIIEVDETYPAELPPHKVPEFLSRLKADAYRRMMHLGQLYITADTVVIVDSKVLGKPTSEADACDMLEMLSGRSHMVVTGVTLSTLNNMRTFSAETRVDFAEIPAEEIRNYVERYKPMDKAGAYGIQEWIGAVGIRSINGSFYNVMGLPVHRLWDELKRFF